MNKSSTEPGMKGKYWHWLACSLGIVFTLIPIAWAISNYDTYYGTDIKSKPLISIFGYSTNSVQFLLILIGTCLIFLFVIIRLINHLPEIHKLKNGTAKIYFSTTVNLMIAGYAGFGIGFSILWGNLYTFAIQQVADYVKYIDSLRGQGIVLLLFIFFSSITVLITFLIPLLKQINDTDGVGKCQ